jgi:hypothetical protein
MWEEGAMSTKVRLVLGWFGVLVLLTDYEMQIQIEGKQKNRTACVHGWIAR